MNEEKNLKLKMATMAVLMGSSLSMIASARAKTATIVDSTPEAVNYFHLVEMKGNVHFYTTRRDYTRTDSEDLHNIFTNDHITSQMITLPHKHLYIMLLVVFQLSSQRKSRRK
jgi:hypothetical protein